MFKAFIWLLRMTRLNRAVRDAVRWEPHEWKADDLRWYRRAPRAVACDVPEPTKAAFEVLCRTPITSIPPSQVS